MTQGKSYILARFSNTSLLQKYLTRTDLCMCKERGRNHNLVVNKKRNMKAN